MALSTRNRRFSIMGFGTPVPRVLPEPDGTIDEFDRAQHLYLYAGLVLAGPIIGAENRYSLILLDLPIGHLLPVPNGSISARDRQVLLMKYRGILFQRGVSVPPMQPINVWMGE